MAYQVGPRGPDDGGQQHRDPQNKVTANPASKGLGTTGTDSLIRSEAPGRPPRLRVAECRALTYGSAPSSLNSAFISRRDVYFNLEHVVIWCISSGDPTITGLVSCWGIEKTGGTDDG